MYYANTKESGQCGCLPDLTGPAFAVLSLGFVGFKDHIVGFVMVRLINLTKQCHLIRSIFYQLNLHLDGPLTCLYHIMYIHFFCLY